jgi:large subunit ribosomal protein L23
MTLRPRVSEKAYAQSQERNTYAFDVPRTANKVTVTQAVTSQFKVTVESVNIMNVKGKAKRTIRKGGRVTAGKDSDFKKAYVTLKAGDSIAIFAAAEEADAKSAKKEKK